MDSRPTAHTHIDALKLRMQDISWVLYPLKLAEFDTNELCTVYKTVVRPVLDFYAVIYHPMLTGEQDQIVERMQTRALKFLLDTA